MDKNANKPEVDVTKCPYYSNDWGREDCSIDDIGCMDKIKPCQKEYCLWYAQQQVKTLNVRFKKIEKIIKEDK